MNSLEYIFHLEQIGHEVKCTIYESGEPKIFSHRKTEAQAERWAKSLIPDRHAYSVTRTRAALDVALRQRAA